MAPALDGMKTLDFGFRQLSCRLIGSDAAVANAYDSFSGVGPGGPITMHGRSTLVFGREAGRWKIVRAHFSPLPRE